VGSVQWHMAATGEFTAEAAPYPARGRGCIRSVLTLKQRLSLWFARTYEAARETPASPSGHSSAAPARPETCAAQANMPRARSHPTDGEEAPGGRKIASPPNRNCPRRYARGCTKSLKARSTCKRILQKRRAYSGKLHGFYPRQNELGPGPRWATHQFSLLSGGQPNLPPRPHKNPLPTARRNVAPRTLLPINAWRQCSRFPFGKKLTRPSGQ
jgi:hypothetical protein